MSKIETIKNLPDSPQLQVLRSIKDLQEQMQLLPEALSQHLSEHSAQQITPILQQFDQINHAQRQSIQALVDEISLNTTQALQQQLLLLTGKTDTLSNTLIKVEKAAEFLEKAQKPIQAATWKVTEAADQIQKQPWKKLLSVAAMAAVLASILVVGGMHGLSKLQQNPEIKDVQVQQLWERATLVEQNLMLEIYKRPSK